MIFTVDAGGLIEFLLMGEIPGGDDERTVIGISRVAYISAKDPGHIFLAAARWHDAAYQTGASIQQEWTRAMVDRRFLMLMLDELHSDIYNFSDAEKLALDREAVTLYLIVRKYGAAAWEGI